MIDLETAQARYEALRDRDRTIASMRSKQRMVPVFEHLLDSKARTQIEEELVAALAEVRRRARDLALQLARKVFVELHVEDLGRLGENLQRFEARLDAEPSDRLDACHDLLTFVREREELARDLDERPAPEPT